MKTTIKTVFIVAILILFTSPTFGNNKKVITAENDVFSTSITESVSNLDVENWMVDYKTWNQDTIRHEKMGHKKIRGDKHRSHKCDMRHGKHFSKKGNMGHKGNMERGDRSEMTPEKLYKMADMMEKRAGMIREKADMMEKHLLE